MNDKPWKDGVPQNDADHLAVRGRNLGFMTDLGSRRHMP
jgi:hypothetical protein